MNRLSGAGKRRTRLTLTRVSSGHADGNGKWPRGRPGGREANPSPVSMIDADLFDKLEQIAVAIRGDTRPFGGMQVSSAHFDDEKGQCADQTP